MAEKVKQTKTETENKWFYQHEDRRIEKVHIAYVYGQTFTY